MGQDIVEPDFWISIFFCLKSGHVLENFEIFGLFLFSATVLRELSSRYEFQTSSIIFSALFSIGINSFCQNWFWNKATIFFFRKMCLAKIYQKYRNFVFCSRKTGTLLLVYIYISIFIKFKCVCLSVFLSVFLSVTVFLPDGLSDCPEIWHVD